MGIDISRMNKAEVLMKLFNYAKVGNSHSNPNGVPFHRLDMTLKEAEMLLKVSPYQDWIAGRCLKIDLTEDTLDIRLYEENNGYNSVEKALFPRSEVSKKYPAKQIMKVMRRARQNGKTVALVKLSHETRRTIIVPNMVSIKRVEDVAKQLGLNIPKPLSIEQLRRNEGLRLDKEEVLVDDLDLILHSIFKRKISVATTSGEVGLI